MRFPRITRFDTQFDNVPELNWYPYVGVDFENTPRRIMVYAHNIPVKPLEYAAKNIAWARKDTWANAIEEYTYTPKEKYNRAFQAFIKGAVGIRGKFDSNSDIRMTCEIDRFVNKIAYINFIQELVISEKQLVQANTRQIEMSQRINKQILRILGITHCICWGKQVYQHLVGIKGYRIVANCSLSQTGFGQGLIETEEGAEIRLLKIFHPSMPSFRPHSDETHTIISSFIN